MKKLFTERNIDFVFIVIIAVLNIMIVIEAVELYEKIKYIESVLKILAKDS